MAWRNLKGEKGTIIIEHADSGRHKLPAKEEVTTVNVVKASPDIIAEIDAAEIIDDIDEDIDDEDDDADDDADEEYVKKYKADLLKRITESPE